MPIGPTRVNGGVISDQMLTGSLKYFKMTGAFANAMSAGGVNLDSFSVGGDAPVTHYFVVGRQDLDENGNSVGEVVRPVPGSLADLALRALMEKCTIVEIGFVGAPGSESELHFSAANTSFGWMDYSDPADVKVDIDAMELAVGLLANDPAVPGGPVTVPALSGTFDITTTPPVTADVSTTVTITEVPFNLA